MDNTRITSRAEAELWLRAACERTMRRLAELSSIHLALDGPETEIGEANLSLQLRLRKACLHLLAITSWPVSPEALHIAGPEIRAAREQLDLIAKERRSEGRASSGLSHPGAGVKHEMRLLDALSHPTPIILIQDLHLGGLGGSAPNAWLERLYILLGALVVEFGVALAELGDSMGHPVPARIVEMFNNVSAELTSVTPNELFLFEETSK